MKFKKTLLMGSCLLLMGIQGVYASYNADWHGRKVNIERLREGEPLSTGTTFCFYSMATNKFVAAEKNTPDIWADGLDCLKNDFAQFYVKPTFYYDSGVPLYDVLSNKSMPDANDNIVVTNNDHLYFEKYKKRRVETKPRIVEAQKADASILKATPYERVYDPIYHMYFIKRMDERGLYTKDTGRGRILTNGKGENINDRVMVLKVYQ